MKSKLHLPLKNKRNVCVQMEPGKAQMEDVHKIQHHSPSSSRLGKGVKRRQENLKNHLNKEPEKPDNAFYPELLHTGKIRFHNWNMECCKGLHSYPKGQW